VVSTVRYIAALLRDIQQTQPQKRHFVIAIPVSCGACLQDRRRPPPQDITYDMTGHDIFTLAPRRYSVRADRLACGTPRTLDGCSRKRLVDAHLLLARTFRCASLPRGQPLAPLLMPVVSVASYKRSVISDCPRRLGPACLDQVHLGHQNRRMRNDLEEEGRTVQPLPLSSSPHVSSCPCPEWEMDIQADPSATRCSCGSRHGRGWSRSAVATWHCKVKLS